MTKRLTTRFVRYGSDEIRQLTVELIDTLGDETLKDLSLSRFDFYRDDEDEITLVETMGDEKVVVGFVINDGRTRYTRNLYHGYSFVTHDLTFNRTEPVAIKWVKTQSKSSS